MGADPDNAAVGKLPGSSPVNVPTRHGPPPPQKKGSPSKGGGAKPTPGKSKVTDIEKRKTGSLYFPGKEEGRPPQYLLETGRTKRPSAKAHKVA